MTDRLTARLALVMLGLALSACGQTGTAPATPTAATASASEPATAPAKASAAPSPSAPPPIVGQWFGVHRCERIMDVMTAAGMPEQGLLNIIDAGTLPGVTAVTAIKDTTHPCDGAVEVKHSHFFTAAGQFGSRDSIGTQVDDGPWKLVDTDTILIGDTPFGFSIDGDVLHLTPVDVGPCPTGSIGWCKEAWKLMVAMPGMGWQRG
jgi:hypothetical protein